MRKKIRFPPPSIELIVALSDGAALNTFRDETYECLKRGGWEPLYSFAMRKSIEDKEYGSMRSIVAFFDCCIGSVHVRSEPEPVWFRKPVDVIQAILVDWNHALKPIRVSLEKGKLQVSERRRFDGKPDFQSSGDVANWIHREGKAVAHEAIRFSRVIPARGL